MFAETGFLSDHMEKIILGQSLLDMLCLKMNVILKVDLNLL